MARLLSRLRRLVHCEHFSLRANFGLDDPADTGCAYGALAPALLVATRLGWHVDCQPNFLRPCLAWSCAATFRVIPLSVIGAALTFTFSPPVLRALYAWKVGR